MLEEVSKTQLQVLDRGASVAATFDRGLSAMTKSQEAIEGAGSAARQIMEEAQASGRRVQATNGVSEGGRQCATESHGMRNGTR